MRYPEYGQLGYPNVNHTAGAATIVMTYNIRGKMKILGFLHFWREKIVISIYGQDFHFISHRNTIPIKISNLDEGREKIYT